ncbi:MAG: heavy metal translocating P-type ATPase [Chloroflexi bacterium]|nr:heavy metal translocating P-type ATPase [Chloroflexota bacterium]
MSHTALASSSESASPAWQFSSCCIDLDQTDPGEEAWKLLTRLALGIVFSMDTMMMSFFLYSDWARAAIFGGEPTIPSSIVLLFKLNMLLGSTLTMLVLVPPILRASWDGLRQRRMSTDTLIALGSLSGYAASLYGIATGGEVYFDTATTILVFVTAGHYLELRARARGSEALERLLARAPDMACVVRGGVETDVPAAAVALGETVIVRPGGSIPVDGEVIDGAGSVDEASITGEAEPVFKEAGERVYSGAVNLDGRLIIRATGVGEDRAMARLVRHLREALTRRAPVQRLADRVSAIFVPLTVLCAALAFAFWCWRDGASHGLMAALAVLLIACPCALGVATPLAIWAGMGRAAEGGVLVRSAEALEKLAGVKAVFFDKTGTLTKGTFLLRDTIPAAGIDGGQLIGWAASLETASEHPLGRAVVAHARAHHAVISPVSEFRAMPGLGVVGQVGGASKVAVGSERFMQRMGWPLCPTLSAERARLHGEGRTVVCVGWDGVARGLLGFVESIRPEAPETVRELTALGFAVEALTGDDRSAGEAVSRRLGIRVHSNLLPDDKERLIAEARSRLGPVAMVGDGLNDAPAMARSDVGIALGCGVDVTRETADVSLIGSDLRQVVWAARLAHETYRTIRQNLWWAFFYNAVGIGLALFGILHPIISALAMVLSNLFVVGNSLRLARGSAPKDKDSVEETFVEEFAAAG